MMNIPYLALILQGIPEEIAVVTLAFTIAGIPLMWKKIIPLGIGLAFIAYIIRLFPIPFGIHTIAIIVLLFIALLWLSQGDFSLALIASLFSCLALIILEYISLSFFMLIFNLKPEELYVHQYIRILSGEPHVLLMFIVAFLLIKTKNKRNKRETNEFL